MPAKNGNRQVVVGAEPVLSQTFSAREGRFPVGEIARQICVCKKTAYELLASGQIGHLKVGNRFYATQRDIDEFLASRYRPAKRA
jgi:excisionase family DNA binding protein